MSPGVGYIIIKGYQNAETLAQVFNNYQHPSGNVLVSYISNPGHSVPPSTLASVVSSPMPGAPGLAPMIPQMTPAALVPHLQSLSLHQVSSAPPTPALQHSHIMPHMLASPPDPFLTMSFPHAPPVYQPPPHFQMSNPQAYMPPIPSNFPMSPQMQSPEYWMPAGPNPFYSPNYPVYGAPRPHNMQDPLHRNYNGRPRGYSINHKRNPEGQFYSPQYDNNYRRRGTYAGTSRASNLENSYRLFIGNIPYATQWQELKDFLRTAGEIYRVEIPENSDGRAKGFAIATYQSKEIASNAIEQFNGKEFNGRELTVRFDKYNYNQNGPHSYYHNDNNKNSGVYGAANRSHIPSFDSDPPST